MNLRLKTNIDTEAKLNELQSLLQVSSKAAVIRLANAFSLKMNGDPRIIDNKMTKYDVQNQNGADYIRYTIFGDDEFLYKLMMEQHLHTYLQDYEFFPELTNAHLNRGITELMAEFKLATSKEKLIVNIMKNYVR